MCFFKKKIEPETTLPKSNEIITLTELATMLHSKYQEASIHLSDSTYLLCDYDDVALFLAQDQTNKYGYSLEDYDCDDFAYRLMGQFSIPDWSNLCLGIIWTATHAFNLFISEDREIFFIEPQNDTISENLFSNSEVKMIVI